MISEEGTFRQIAHAELSAIRHRIAKCCNGGNFRFRLKDSWDGFDGPIRPGVNRQLLLAARAATSIIYVVLVPHPHV